MTTPKSVEPAQGAMTESNENTEAAGVDPAIQGALGRKLRESYDQVVKEAVPDKFMQLLDQLKQSEASGKTGKS
jgi:hypothetical protein